MYTYRITMEAISPLLENAEIPHLQLAVANHDDLFKVVKAVRSKNFMDADKAAALALGLKLFSEITLERRRDALFAPMIEPLKQFIGRLKAIPPSTQASILDEAGE